MGIYNAINACAHLQNVTRAKLGMTSLPSTKVNLAMALALHRAGFLSSVHRGGPQPPTPEDLVSDPEPATHTNAATRRIWLGLKYWNNQPVLRELQSLHRPKRPITIKVEELHRVVRGFPSRDGLVKGLRLGECIFIATDKGLLEGREALARNMGGLLVFRAR
ncbi:mitochondrial 37S ribosomal protein S8 [Plectosphaerella cucumerina]|jgi:small subunit ribosomal protein S8|uniref:Mitochondrial 37S ribosomal protein S8 n=1 Tax=Plectosphaerella cucumerina TaxID=40658 RepID=A0A8K0WZX9_9PEZI|nr:mitochondrial 37S ribosomal protein S8 [Plectosphaerella cucumerina]